MAKKCPECGGKLVQVSGVRKGVRYSALRCEKCGDEIMTLEQAASYLDEAQRAKLVTFSKWGQSLAVRIPAEAVRKYGLSVKEKGRLLLEKDGFKIVPA